jgi:hypothetical protein
MQKVLIALTVAAGVVAWATSTPTSAAMIIADGKANMSLIEQAKGRGKLVCSQKLIFTCCQRGTNPEYCYIK